MALHVQCPFCKGSLPFRIDKRGGRYFRCGVCQTAFFFSGKSVIDRLEEGGLWSFQVKKELETSGESPFGRFL